MKSSNKILKNRIPPLGSGVNFLLPYFIIAIALLLGSCATTHVSTRASKARLITAEQVQLCEKNCQFLGQVTGMSYYWWFFNSEISHNNALNELLKDAVELGATHVFVNTGNYRSLRGDAYVCSFCQLEDGKRDKKHCENDKGEFIIALNQQQCEQRGNNWIKRADNRHTCESKGGTWIPDPDILRLGSGNQADTEEKGGK
jgi:hypothetical protein